LNHGGQREGERQRETRTNTEERRKRRVTEEGACDATELKDSG